MGQQAGDSGQRFLQQLVLVALVAGIAGALTLVLRPGASVRGDIRLDDYETSWPDHVEVQDAGVALLEANQTVEVSARRRHDRSTIEVVADGSVPPATVDSLMARAVEDDQLSRAPTTPVEEIRSDLAAVVDEFETGGDRSVELADESIELRRELALTNVQTVATRSRFVQLTPATLQQPGPSLLQWIVSGGLLGLGGVGVAEGLRRR